MSEPKGGYAFPVGDNACGPMNAGMTLRDYFAAASLSGFDLVSDYSKGPCNMAVAERAYEIADAMLAAREKAQ